MGVAAWQISRSSFVSSGAQWCGLFLSALGVLRHSRLVFFRACCFSFLYLVFIAPFPSFLQGILFLPKIAIAGQHECAFVCDEDEEGDDRGPDFEQQIYQGVFDVVWSNWIGHYKHKARSGRDDPVMLEVFAGVEATHNQFSFYSGGVSGALGLDPRWAGVRLKAAHGASWYQYFSARQVGASYVTTKFEGRSRFMEGLIGYEFSSWDTIFKVYGGVISIMHDIDPQDLNNQLQGRETGGKLLIEAWRHLDDVTWFSAYGSYSTANDYYHFHGRLGRQVSDYFDGGVEFGAFGDKQYDALKLGAFSRFQVGDGEFTVSAGVSGDYNQPDSFYVSGQFYSKLRLSDVAAYEAALQGLFSP